MIVNGGIELIVIHGLPNNKQDNRLQMRQMPQEMTSIYHLHILGTTDAMDTRGKNDWIL